MKINLTLLLILFTFIAYGQSSPYSKAVDNLLSSGKQTQVLPYLEAELKKQPKNTELLRLLGFHNVQNNQLEAGEKYYREALAIDPKCARCYLNIGKIHGMKGDSKSAAEYIEKAVELAPEDSYVFSTRARLREMQGDDAGALADHNKTIALEPQNYMFYINRGSYYTQHKNADLALADYNKAISLEPENYSGYFGRSSLYNDLQKYPEALKDLDKAISLDSTEYNLYVSRGVVCNRLGQLQQSVESYTKAIQLRPDYFLAYYNRSRSYYQLEDLDASCQDNQQAKRLMVADQINDPQMIQQLDELMSDYCDDSKASYFYQRGIAQYNLGKFKDALEVYRHGLEKFPNNKMILSFQGNAYLALKDYKNALNSYNLVIADKATLVTEIRQNPRFANATAVEVKAYYDRSLATVHCGIATCKIDMGEFDVALTEINEAFKLCIGLDDAGLETYHNLRGNIYLATAKYELAVADFNRSIEIDSLFALAYVNRAVARASQGEKIKISSYSIGGRLVNQPLKFVWAKMGKPSAKNSALTAAISDCNEALKLDKNLGFAYYVRGQVKRLLNEQDYCTDLLKAKKLGLNVEANLLRDCGGL